MRHQTSQEIKRSVFTTENGTDADKDFDVEEIGIEHKLQVEKQTRFFLKLGELFAQLHIVQVEQILRALLKELTNSCGSNFFCGLVQNGQFVV